MTKHVRFGGSTASRQLACPAWTNLAAEAPQIERTTPAAERGTRLHEIMERLYLGEDTGLAALADLSEAESPDDQDALVLAWQMTEATLDELCIDEYECETFLTAAEDIGGSADMEGWGEGVYLILDYKFGYQPVKSPDQFLFYMMCARAEDRLKGATRLVAAVVQPAVSETALLFEFSHEDLDAFEARYMASVQETRVGVCVGRPGPHCQFCPAAVYSCEAKRNQAQAFMQLDTSRLAEAMDMVAEMKAHIKHIEAETFATLEAGHPVAGWKLVEKRASRSWVDPAKAQDALRKMRGVSKESYVSESLKSPPQVEKAIGKEKYQKIAAHVTTASTGTTLAPESDKRDAVTAKTAVPEALGKILDA